MGWIDDFIDKVESPYIHNTFSKWREKGYEEFELMIRRLPVK